MTRTESYKGHPTLSLNAEAKFPFTFGLAKAKLILSNLDAIRAFVAANDTAPAPADRFDMDNEDRAAERIGGAR